MLSRRRSYSCSRGSARAPNSSGTNIKVRADRPGVGANLQDRYEVGVVSEFDRPFKVLDKACKFHPPAPGDPADPCFARWERGKGVYASNGAVLSVVTRSRRELVRPDLFIFGFPANFRGYYRGYSADLLRHDKVFTWVILKAHTANTGGTVRLRSDEPTERPSGRTSTFITSRKEPTRPAGISTRSSPASDSRAELSRKPAVRHVSWPRGPNSPLTTSYATTSAGRPGVTTLHAPAESARRPTRAPSSTAPSA